MSNFDYIEVELPNKSKWVVARAKIDFSGSLYAKALEQAKLKSQFTMSASQAGVNRSDNLKYSKQLMGTLAEIYSQEYLNEILRDNKLNEEWFIIRYDDVRTDGFKSPANEYDIKVNSKDASKSYLVEARSSITYDRGFTIGLENYDVIGPYESFAKKGEKLNDFYLRPLYEFTDYKAEKYDPLKFEELLLKGKVILYIVAGTTKELMLSKGYTKSMGQFGTLYRVVKIVNIDDAKKFHQTFISKLK